MTIVMGVDQHRAQITAQWVDTDTGEIGRARVAPADRATVRRFLARFAGQQLEVALEATTGWRFVVEELNRVGAVVHLAEPAETAERRGRKKRAKTDRADARLLRELVMTGSCRSRGSGLSTSSICGRVCGCVTRWLTSAAVAAADPRGALPPRRAAAPWARAFDRRGSRLGRGATVAAHGARAGHHRASDDRSWTPSLPRSTRSCARTRVGSRGARR